MAISGLIYNTVFKRTSTYALAIVTAAFFLEAAIDRSAEYIFNETNKGKLWHHIQDNYKSKEAE